MTQAQNDGEEDTRQHELVIIRRRGNAEDAPHKGGVWKIAHADFMTALMAFFLVMWLITATDDKTVTGIANYFNPMRLSDQSTRPKGVFTMEPGGGQEDGEASSDTKEKAKPSSSQKPATARAEAAMFKDPYKALDQIAAEAAEATSQGTPEGQGGPAQNPGDAFRDPFNPDAHYSQGRPGDVGREAGRDGEGRGAAANEGSGKGEDARPQASDGYVADRGKANLKQAIERIVRQSDFAAKPGIDVTPTDEGLLISITDQFDFEMFGIASAEPTPELVVLMGRIGELLAKQRGQIVVRGHTDGRPFRSDAYDNWRLSTARAHMAHYMLVRSGVAEERIIRIEGHADHELKIADDPYAAANRRIEILLTEGDL